MSLNTNAVSAPSVTSPERADARPSVPVVPTEAEVTRALRSAPHRMLDIGHSRVAYWRFGRGPDVVFVHGWPLDAATFRRVVPYLAESFTCHLLDLPGVGQTVSAPDAPVGLVPHAASVRAAIDVLGLSRYALLAHDSGGFIARLVAADDPRVAGVSLGNTEVPEHTPPLVIAYALLARSRVGARVLRAMLRSRTLRRSAFGFGGCFEDAAYVDGAFYDLFVAPMIASTQVASRQLRLIKSLDHATLAQLPDVHRRIRAPVQLIWGTDDPFFPLAKARAMVPQFGGPVTFEEIPRAKVFPHEDHAAAFAGYVAPFLRACFAA